MAPVAAVQEFGFLVVPRWEVELFGEGGEGGDFPFGHFSASPGCWAARDAAVYGRGSGTKCLAQAAATRLLKGGEGAWWSLSVPGLAAGQGIHTFAADGTAPTVMLLQRGRWRVGGVVSSLGVAGRQGLCPFNFIAVNSVFFLPSIDVRTKIIRSKK